MTWTELSQLLTPVGVLAGVWVSWSNSRNLRKTQAQVQKIEVATNSMKDALVLATAKASHLEGVVEGKQAEKENPS